MKKDVKINVMEHRGLLGSYIVNILSKHGYAANKRKPGETNRELTVVCRPHALGWKASMLIKKRLTLAYQDYANQLGRKLQSMAA
jgi:hypothetical protein